MEPVAPDFVLFVQLVRNGINVSVFPEIGIVGRIEHAHVICPRHHRLAGLKAADRGRAVQRVKLYDAFEIGDLLVAEHGGSFQPFPAVRETVPHGRDLLHASDDAQRLIGEYLQNVFDRRAVVGKRRGRLVVLLARALMRKHTVYADAFAVALGKRLFGFHVEKLILQRRTAGVDNKYFHYLSKLLIAYLENIALKFRKITVKLP